MGNAVFDTLLIFLLHFSKGLLKLNVVVEPSVVPCICTCCTTTLTPVYWTEISMFSGLTRYEPCINSHANKYVKQYFIAYINVVWSFWIWKPDDKAEYVFACILTVWLPNVIINNYNCSQSLSVVAYLPSCTSLFKYANLWQQNISEIKYEDGWHDTTSSLCTKMENNFQGFRCFSLAVLAAFAAWLWKRCCIINFQIHTTGCEQNSAVNHKKLIN